MGVTVTEQTVLYALLALNVVIWTYALSQLAKTF
jgi:hypothetical protein